MSKLRVTIAALIVSILTFIIFLPALNNDFVGRMDDDEYIVDNHHIKSIDTTSLSWMFIAFYSANWHPLSWLSHAIDYAIWGINPFGHHLTSLILHSMNTFLVVLLAVKLVGYGASTQHIQLYGEKRLSNTSVIAGIITGLLFGLHPLHVQSVAWVSERKDVLYAFFFLLSIIAYLKYAESIKQKKTLPYALCLFFFILSLLSKPMAVTLPLVLFILDYYPLERLKLWHSFSSHALLIREKAPFFALSVIVSVFTVAAQEVVQAIAPLDLYPLWMRVMVSIRAIGFYTSKIIFPLSLYPYYPYPTKETIFSAVNILYLLAAIVLTVFCIFFSKKKAIRSAWLYFIITLLPVIGLVQVSIQATADRYTYLTALGPMLILGLAAQRLYDKARAKETNYFSTTMIALVLIITMAMSFLTLHQIKTWKNYNALWEAEKKIGKDFLLASEVIGDYYLKKGNFKEALRAYYAGIDIDPFSYICYYKIGLTYVSMRDSRNAIFNLKHAIKLNSAFREAAIQLKTAYDLAIEELSGKINRNNNDPKLYVERGNYFAFTWQFDRALDDFNKAIDLNKSEALAYYGRGAVYLEKKDFIMARRNFRRAAALGNKDAQVFLKGDNVK